MAARSMRLESKHLDKLKQLHEGHIQLPKYIDEWNAAIEDKRAVVASMMTEKIHSAQLVHRCRIAVRNMMLRKDTLLMKWLEDEPHKTWNDLRAERPPSAEDLFKYTVEDTEDFFVGPGAAAFVRYLDEHWPGFMKDVALACLHDCDSLLAEGIELTSEVRRMLVHPSAFFNTSKYELIEQHFVKWTSAQGIDEKPVYVKRLIIAYMKVALGNPFAAFEEMEYARCEAVEPDFESLVANRDPRADTYLVAAQKWIIAQMLEQWPMS